MKEWCELYWNRKPLISCYYIGCTYQLFLIARSSKDSVSSEGNSSEVAEESKPKKLKKLKKEKELKSPVELQPPLGPLVALGKPRDKLKRPRYTNGSNTCMYMYYTFNFIIK